MSSTWCGVSKCSHCACWFTCEKCGEGEGDKVCYECKHKSYCEGWICWKSHCQDCNDGEEYGIKYCEECESSYCLECKVDRVKKDVTKACRGCAADAVPLILEEMAKLRMENEEVIKENRELKRKIDGSGTT